MKCAIKLVTTQRRQAASCSRAWTTGRAIRVKLIERTKIKESLAGIRFRASVIAVSSSPSSLVFLAFFTSHAHTTDHDDNNRLLWLAGWLASLFDILPAACMVLPRSPSRSFGPTDNAGGDVSPWLACSRPISTLPDDWHRQTLGHTMLWPSAQSSATHVQLELTWRSQLELDLRREAA